MNKQKICIIGANLTGLVTAISLSKLNCEIDLITGHNNQNLNSNRTLAISQHNLEFLNKLNISKSIKQDIWPCSKIKLYSEIESEKFSEIFEFNNYNDQMKIFYIIKNSELIKHMMAKIEKTKNISIIKNKEINKIENQGLLKGIKFNNNKLKYNLIIVCTGSNSDLVKNLFRNQTIENSYNETSVTVILRHKSLENNIARQIFLNDAILALLPISKTKTSIVLSIKKNAKQSDLFFKNKIKFYTKKYLKNIIFEKNLEYKDLNFLIRKKYYTDRILLFGDALHVVHPFVGQGFNMILRDLENLEKILSKKISLGLDIGSYDILSEFSNEIKSSNFVFSIGINILKNSFSIKNNHVKKIRDDAFKILNKNDFTKNIFFNIANRGFRF